MGRLELAGHRRILTHCNTGRLTTAGDGTALGIIHAKHAAGELDEVIACEARPLLQGGRLTAWELGQAGVPYRLIVDGAAGFAMARGLVEAVIVGCDRVAANGDTANKVGTYGLAVLAERHGLPFYVAGPLTSFDAATPDGDHIVIEERDPAEVRRLRRRHRHARGCARLEPRLRRHPRIAHHGLHHRGRCAAGSRIRQAIAAALAASREVVRV